MSGDLEDFLRRAAQRRKAKAAQADAGGRPPNHGQAKGERQTSRARPEYSNRKTERLVEDPEEVILAAEVVEDVHSSMAAQRQALGSSRRAAAESKPLGLSRSSGRGSVSDRRSVADRVAGSVPPSGDPVKALLELLRKPGGIKQAILLKEILDRPEQRW